MKTIKRLRDRQGDLRLIWEDAITTAPPHNQMVIEYLSDNGHHVLVEHAVIRRGFKVTYNNRMGVYELLSVHSGDFYKYATDEEIDHHLRVGFVRACDLMQIERYKGKIEGYAEKIKEANSDRNDSMITHWRNRRLELTNYISMVEENLEHWPAHSLK